MSAFSVGDTPNVREEQTGHRLAELILVSLYYRGRNAVARHRHVTLSRTLVRSPLSLLHPPVHPVARVRTRAPTCPIPSAIRVTATFIRGTTDWSVGPVHAPLCTQGCNVVAVVWIIVTKERPRFFVGFYSRLTLLVTRYDFCHPTFARSTRFIGRVQVSQVFTRSRI